MAGEIQCDLGPSYTGITAYAMLRNSAGLIYNTASAVLQAFNAANIADYDIALTEQGASGYFAGDMPAVAAGVYNITVKQRSGGSPAVSDNSIGGGEIQWDGTAVISLSGVGGQSPGTRAAGP